MPLGLASSSYWHNNNHNEREKTNKNHKERNSPTIRITKLKSRERSNTSTLSNEKKNHCIPFKLVQKKYLNPIPIQSP